MKPIREAQEAVNKIHQQYIATSKQAPTKARQSHPVASQSLNDRDLLEVIKNSKQGGKVMALFYGDIDGYPSASEADQALANHLAWWCDFDIARADALFRQSALYRPEKWDKKHHSDGRTYGQGTLEKACEGQTPGDGYTGKGESSTIVDDSKQPSNLDKRPHLISMAEVKAETIKWLWPGYIPLGKLTFLEGDPGLGKTFVALKIASHLSRGEAYPSNDYRPPLEPTNVLYMTAEDGLGDTLKPRLEAAGADCSRVFVLKGWQGEIEGKELEGLISLADIDLIAKAIESLRPSLVVIDPIQGYMGGKTDIHRANEVREVLTPVVKLAEKYGCAIVAIRHLNKSRNSKALYSGMGSIDFAAAARSILRVDKMPENPKHRVLAQVKNNLSEFASALEFRIEDGAVKWLSEVDVQADDLAQEYGNHKDSSARDEAVDFLQTVLADGARLSREVKRESLELGITESTLKRAKKELETQTKRIHTGEKRGEGSWYIALSHDDLEALSTSDEPLKPDKGNTVLDDSVKEVQANLYEPLKESRQERASFKKFKGFKENTTGDDIENLVGSTSGEL